MITLTHKTNVLRFDEADMSMTTAEHFRSCLRDHLKHGLKLNVISGAYGSRFVFGDVEEYIGEWFDDEFNAYITEQGLAGKLSDAKYDAERDQFSDQFYSYDCVSTEVITWAKLKEICLR